MKPLLASKPVIPLYCCAPEVANGAQVYSHLLDRLRWSGQPVLILEKDNDLSIVDRSRQHVEDLLHSHPGITDEIREQIVRGERYDVEADTTPYPPFVLAGTSYGGVVALEVAQQLQELGLKVASVIMFDSPHPNQLRSIVPKPPNDVVADEDLEAFYESLVTDDDLVELMRTMLLVVNVYQDSFENLSFHEKLATFLPVMRLTEDDNTLDLDGCEQRLREICRALKSGEWVSDLRHHRFTHNGGRLSAPAKLLFLKAAEAGKLPYVNDASDADASFVHGISWSEHADELEVLTVAGDHFTMSRFDGEDSFYFDNALRKALESVGWVCNEPALQPPERHRIRMPSSRQRLAATSGSRSRPGRDRHGRRKTLLNSRSAWRSLLSPPPPARTPSPLPPPQAQTTVISAMRLIQAASRLPPPVAAKLRSLPSLGPQVQGGGWLKEDILRAARTALNDDEIERLVHELKE